MSFIASALRPIAGALILTIGTVSAAVAAGADAEPEKKPLWEMNLAAFARYGESYPASEETQVNIVPLPFPIYRGKILRVGAETGKPVTTRIFRRDRIKLDIDFGLNFPADSDDIDARTGMPDLDLLAEAGPELELQFVKGPRIGNAFLALQLRGAFSFDGLDPTWRGLIFSSEFKYTRPFYDDRSELRVRLTPEWAGNEYMDFFYGVAPEFATAEREAYTAKGGYLGTKLNFSLKHELNDEFSIRTGVNFGFYQGARNRGSFLYTSETTNGVYFAFLWKFWESDRKVDREFSD
jgi:outer membrane scaffolding protein for murein synthesis (MipA/OmpV family)